MAPQTSPRKDPLAREPRRKPPGPAKVRKTSAHKRVERWNNVVLRAYTSEPSAALTANLTAPVEEKYLLSPYTPPAERRPSISVRVHGGHAPPPAVPPPRSRAPATHITAIAEPAAAKIYARGELKNIKVADGIKEYRVTEKNRAELVRRRTAEV
ncbi:hypothetical protein HWV62_16580 [Athelia sp. TMB]|nr:hypothetical protein HWV62_16580 [Athelia sp. TMB]